MLSISTVPEALAELTTRTGRAWTDSELFDVVTTFGIELHAAPPITAQTTIQKFVIGEGMVEKFRSGPGHAVLAVLFPAQVQQLWVSGETLTSHPSKHNEIDGENRWFTEPVRVTREQVRIKAATLEKILTVWSKTQPASAQNAATPVPVEVAIAAPVVKSEQKPPTNWRHKIQAAAYEHWITLRAVGACPTRHSILESMARWCQVNNVKTDGGIYPRAGYIKNVVLNASWIEPYHSIEQAKAHIAKLK
jgi:hypothetical protein